MKFVAYETIEDHESLPCLVPMSEIAIGIGADVTILDVNARRLAYLDDIFGAGIITLYSTEANIEDALKESDLVIGAVLIPGAQAPRLVSREHLSTMKEGAVIVDVAVDQGGCVETIKPTTHDAPVYNIDGVVHYGVSSMPGAVALTSTLALTGTTLRYGLYLADNGLEEAAQNSRPIATGVNTYDGHITCKGVAEAFDRDYAPVRELLK